MKARDFLAPPHDLLDFAPDALPLALDLDGLQPCQLAQTDLEDVLGLDVGEAEGRDQVGLRVVGLADDADGLLILRDEMPRSLASCYENLVLYLDHIARAYGRQGAAQRQARALRARLENSRMEEIFQQGLHEFIGEFIDSNNRLGAEITEQYLM